MNICIILNSIYNTFIAIVLRDYIAAFLWFVDSYLFNEWGGDMQMRVLLTASQCRVFDTRVTVKACGPLVKSSYINLLHELIFLSTLCDLMHIIYIILFFTPHRQYSSHVTHVIYSQLCIVVHYNHEFWNKINYIMIGSCMRFCLVINIH